MFRLNYLSSLKIFIYLVAQQVLNGNLVVLTQQVPLNLTVTEGSNYREIMLQFISTPNEYAFYEVKYSVNGWADNLSLIFSSGYMNLNDINTITTTNLTTNQSESIAYCLNTDTCYAVKLDKMNYYSYSSSEFRDTSSTRVICNQSTCDIFSFYKTSNNQEINVGIMIDPDVRYEFVVRTSLSNTTWDSFGQVVSFNLSGGPEIEDSKFNVSCSTASLIFDYITCEVVTNFLRLNSNKTLIYNYPNTVFVEHSESSKKQLLYETYKVDDSNNVVYSFVYYYLESGNFNLTINARKSFNNGTVKKQQSIITKSFSVSEINYVTWTNKASFADPIDIEIIESVPGFEFDLSTKTVDKKVSLNFNDVEKNDASICNIKADFQAYLVQNLTYDSDENLTSLGKWYYIPYSTISIKGFLKDLTVYADNSGKVNIQIVKNANCDTANNCSRFFRTNSSSLNASNFEIIHSFDAIVQTDKNIIGFNNKIPILKTGYFFKIKSDNVKLKKSIVSNSSDMAHFIDDSGSGPLAVEGYALKLEYTLEKYFTDYKCISEIKKFRHSGNFPVYYKTPDNPYTYMTTVRVTDPYKNSKIEINCTQDDRIQISPSAGVECSVNIQTSYRFSWKLNQIQDLSSSSVISNVSTSGSYIGAAGEVLLVDFNNQPASYTSGISYIILNSEMFCDGMVIGYEMIATSAGNVNISQVLIPDCQGNCSKYLESNPSWLFSNYSSNVNTTYSFQANVDIGLNKFELQQELFAAKGTIFLLTFDQNVDLAINTTSAKSDYAIQQNNTDTIFVKLNTTNGTSWRFAFKANVRFSYYSSIMSIKEKFGFTQVPQSVQLFNLGLKRFDDNTLKTIYVKNYRFIDTKSLTLSGDTVGDLDCSTGNKLILILEVKLTSPGCFNSVMTPVVTLCYLKHICRLNQSTIYDTSFCGPNVNVRNLTVNYECIARRFNDENYIGNYIGQYAVTVATGSFDHSKTTRISCLTSCKDMGLSYAGLNAYSGCLCPNQPTDSKSDPFANKHTNSPEEYPLNTNNYFVVYEILYFDVCYEIDSLYWDTYSSIYLGPMYEKCLRKIRMSTQKIGCADTSYAADQSLVATNIITATDCSIFCSKWYFRYLFVYNGVGCGCSNNAYKHYSTILDKSATCSGFQINEIIYFIKIECPETVNTLQFFDCIVTLSLQNSYATLNHTVQIYNNGSLETTTVVIGQNPTNITIQAGLKNGFLTEIKARELTMYSSATAMVNITGDNYLLLNNHTSPKNLSCFPFIIQITNATVSNDGCELNVVDILNGTCDFKNYCTLSTLDQSLNAICSTGGQKSLRVEWDCFGRSLNNERTSNYIGCYQDNNLNRDFSYKKQIANMKTSDCITECAAQQYVYAATQNDICYCGFTYGKYGISTNCKKICPGDSGDICGNDQPSDKISNSVYEVLYIDMCYQTIDKRFLGNQTEFSYVSGRLSKCLPNSNNGYNLLGCRDSFQTQQTYDREITELSLENCLQTCTEFGYKYSFYSQMTSACKCDYNYNDGDYSTYVLNKTNCYSQYNFSIYEIIYSIDLVCPRETYDLTTFKCNITVYVPGVLSHTVAVSYNGTIKSVTFNGNVSKVELKFASKGYYEIIARNTYNNATSTKMINVIELPGAATFNAMRDFFSANFSAGSDPISSLSDSNPSLLVDLLTLPGQDMTGCLSNCTNRGACSLNENNKFVCACQEYFVGDSCDEDIRACSKMPCQNKGICTEVIIPGVEFHDFKCNCSSQIYSGTRCEIKFDVCWNKTCNLNGKCFDNSSVPTCNCYKYFSGDNCEIKSAELKAMKATASVTSGIAIAVLCMFYCAVFLADYFKYLHAAVLAIIKG